MDIFVLSWFPITTVWRGSNQSPLLIFKSISSSRSYCGPITTVCFCYVFSPNFCLRTSKKIYFNRFKNGKQKWPNFYSIVFKQKYAQKKFLKKQLFENPIVAMFFRGNSCVLIWSGSTNSLFADWTQPLWTPHHRNDGKNLRSWSCL